MRANSRSWAGSVAVWCATAIPRPIPSSSRRRRWRRSDPTTPTTISNPSSMSRALRSSHRQRHRHFDARRILVNDDLGARERRQKIGLDRIADLVRAQQFDVGIEFDVKLDEGVHARHARAQVVQALYFAMGAHNLLDTVAVGIGKFAVHELVVALAKDVHRTPGED